MPIQLKKLIPHLIVLVLFVIAALAYFSPVLSGKKMYQSDIAQYVGMSKQQKDIKAATGQEVYWTDAAFGGMPTYQLGARYPYNIIKKIDLTIRFLPRPADYLLLYFIGMYILFLVLKVDYKLAFLGALAFGFSTYLIIIIGVGHNAKAHAIAYMPFVISGVLLTFRGKYLWGFVLTCVAMALELVANHFQITYYLGFLVVCIGIAYLIDAFRKKMVPHYFKAVGVMVVAVVVALGLNATNIMATKEYSDASTRGTSDLTINPDGSPKDISTGLNYDYITEYSFGKLETLSLFIPRFMGGGSSDPLPEDSQVTEMLIKSGVPNEQANEILYYTRAYWGDQPIVAAPPYIGAVIIFLAVLALFLVKGRFRWWIVGAFFLSLLLSWGKNFNFLTELFIDYVPLYNKFRAVSSIQVIIELILPLLAIVGLHQYFNDFIKKEQKQKALLWSTGIVGGLTLIFILFKSALFDFATPMDTQIADAFKLPYSYVDAIRSDRMSLFMSDALRTLVFVLLAAATLYFFLKSKLKEIGVIAILAVLIVIDLVGVDKRYVNNENFVQSRIMDNPFPENGANIQIAKDDGHFRVYDITNDAFNSAQANYFHNALGGYHAAKPRRINDLNEFYLREGNIGILNMMNVRYIITQNKGGGPVAQRNPYANGNSWFVENVLIAEDATHEIQLLDSLDTKRTVVVNKKFREQLPLASIQRDSTATIELVQQKPEHLIYESSTKSPQFAVFSEVYYQPGWNAYINNEPVDHIQVNYVLRGMTVPEGNNKIEFKFEPTVIKTGGTIMLASSILLGLVLIGGLYFSFKGLKKKEDQ